MATFSLYLHALGFGGPAIGVVLMAGLAFGSLLTLIIGPLSDRVSRRRLLIVYEVSAMAAALAAILSPNEAVLIAAATLAGFGRGANGAAGPFAPVEQAWIAREVDGEDRRRALAHNATLGFLGMGTGAILIVLPPLFGHGYAEISTFRMLLRCRWPARSPASRCWPGRASRCRPDSRRLATPESRRTSSAKKTAGSPSSR